MKKIWICLLIAVLIIIAGINGYMEAVGRCGI